MKKYLILFIAFFGVVISSKSQEVTTEDVVITEDVVTNREKTSSGFLPEKGDISVALQLGRGNFFDGGLTVPRSPGNNYWVVPGNAPTANVVDDNHNSIVNMVGVEGRYFLNEGLALRLSGGAIIRDTPARDAVPGFIDPDADNVTWIPDYNVVIMNNELKANLVLGVEKHFTSKFERISPYVGILSPMYYSRHSQYDPTVVTDDVTGEVTITDVSVRHVEIFAFGGQVVGGIDYYLAKGFYIGFEIKPFSYIYSISAKYPATGIAPLEADTHTYSFFTQPFFKLGFRF